MFLKLFLVGLWLFGTSNAARMWDYSFVDFDTVLHVPYIHSDIKLQKISRGDYAIDGSFTLDQDIGGKYMFSGKVFRSSTGNDDYKPTPFNMEKQDLDTFFNGVYKKVVMEDLVKCSNLPNVEDTWVEPVAAGTYTLNMCKVNVDNWPDNMMPGFYKLDIEFFDESDTVVANTEVIVQIETNMAGK